ncbi:MAG: YvcK family protein [Clostridia bacterium]|nr:YvcK family protein [Clostridia bacterium]
MYKDARVVAIGGGTGLSTMLRGLKTYTENLTAIVTVADDGGSSGMLRNDLGMLPPGDIRNCILALADTEPIMKQLFTYRFTEGALAGHSFGNLFLAAMNGISNSFDEAVKKVSDVLAVVGRVLPVTNESIRLRAVLDDGKIIEGESHIGHRANIIGNIDRVSLIPANPKPVDGVLDAIEKAQIIVLGPGSLYTSIIPNLLVDGVVEAIKKSSAVKIYVCNLMTQMGETDGYSVYDHVRAIEKHSYKGIFDFVIANNEKIPPSLTEKYAAENAYMIKIDSNQVHNKTRLVQGNLLLIEDEYIRHNFSRLARAIMILYRFSINERKQDKSKDDSEFERHLYETK